MEHISTPLCSPGRTSSAERNIDAEELKQRVRQCARLFAAWPNARPASYDATLLEYLNATRGVRLKKLPRVIDAAIAAGGEFIPPAGEILGRAVRYVIASRQRGYNPHLAAEQAVREEEQRQLAGLRRAHRTTSPLTLDALQVAVRIDACVAPLALGAGR